MHLSARVGMAFLLIVLGLTPPKSSASSSPQQTANTPDTNGQEASRPNPDASGIYHGGKGVSPPLIIHSVDPEFPDKARQKRLAGTCVVSLIVDTTGTPRNVQISKSIESTVPPELRSAARGLDLNAVKAASQYRFKPGTYQGKPIPIQVKVAINYRIY